MKRKIAVLLNFIAQSLVILLLANCSGKAIEDEYFIAWGQDSSGQCYIWKVDVSRKSYIQLVSEHPDCNYKVRSVGQREYFVHSQTAPGKISLYALNKDGLRLESVIATNNIEISSFPEMDIEGSFYFSGIVDGNERIYRANETNVRLLVELTSGMVYNPTPSPNGQHVAFRFFDGANNRRECTVECGSLYRILNVSTQQEIQLEELTDDCSHPVHRTLLWSPGSEYLIFSIGCSNQMNEYLVIYSLIENLVVTKIYSSLFSPSLLGWISEQEIVYDAVDDYLIEGYDAPLPARRIFIYSIADAAYVELGRFPLITASGNRFTINSVNWTSDGRYVAGRLADSIIITDRQNHDVAFSYTQIYDPKPVTTNDNSKASQFQDPKWSRYGEWLAYSSPEQTISFVDKNGYYKYSITIPDVINYEFDWISAVP